jgi:hypothetical protein
MFGMSSLTGSGAVTRAHLPHIIVNKRLKLVKEAVIAGAPHRTRNGKSASMRPRLGIN